METLSWLGGAALLVLFLTCWIPFLIYFSVAMGTCAYYRSKYNILRKVDLRTIREVEHAEGQR